MSIMYPTIFATTIRDLGPLKKIASGLLVAAAGAAATSSLLILKFALEISTAQAATVLSIPCFVVILAFAMTARRAQNRSFADEQLMVATPPQR